MKPEIFEIKPDPKEVEKINNLTRFEMCRLHRFAPAGHIYFDGSKPYWKIFEKRLQSLGGFSPEISKALGW